MTYRSETRDTNNVVRERAKDVPLEIAFFLPPSVTKHKTFKRYLIGITCYRSLDVKQRRKSVVAALEAGE